MQTHSRPLSHALTLVVTPTIGPYLLPTVLPVVRTRHPDLKLRIVEEPSQMVIDTVHDGEIDAAIVALPYLTRGLQVFEFWQEDFYLVNHRSDPLAARDSISSQELRQKNLMLLKVVSYAYF